MNITERSSSDNYNSPGAAKYIIVVICVYAIGIFSYIASHVRRRYRHNEEDKEIGNFLRRAPIVQRDEEMQRRRNLKVAVRPFVELTLNKCSRFAQTNIDLYCSLRAETDVDTTNMFAEEEEDEDIGSEEDDDEELVCTVRRLGLPKSLLKRESSHGDRSRAQQPQSSVQFGACEDASSRAVSGLSNCRKSSPRNAYIQTATAPNAR